MANDKIKKITGSKAFFIFYLIFFGASLFLASMSDAIFPLEIIMYRGEEVSQVYFTEGILKIISIVHMLGGVAFFVRLCASKIESEN